MIKWKFAVGAIVEVEAETFDEAVKLAEEKEVNSMDMVFIGKEGGN